ncbi:MAG: hypothetical protein V7641_1815 [Blastocatellia bacterium]
MTHNDRRFVALFVAVAVLLFAGASAIFRASAQQTKCPMTKVTCPDTVDVGGKLTFSADVRGGDSQVTPTYNWSVSAGSISSGQGTSAIEVDTTEMAGGGTVTATVDVGGFDRECGYGSTASSCTTTVNKKPEARKLDEYGKLKPEDENARLDNFVVELQSDPTAQGYIIAYGGRRSRAGDAKTVAARAKTYLVNKRQLDPQRVITVDGGYREEPSVELWIAPTGGQAPQATPSLDPAELTPAKPAKSAKPKTSTARKKS